MYSTYDVHTVHYACWMCFKCKIVQFLIFPFAWYLTNIYFGQYVCLMLSSTLINSDNQLRPVPCENHDEHTKISICYFLTKCSAITTIFLFYLIGIQENIYNWCIFK